MITVPYKHVTLLTEVVFWEIYICKCTQQKSAATDFFRGGLPFSLIVSVWVSVN